MANLPDKIASKFAQVGGYNVHYIEAGEGDTVIMLHEGVPGASAYASFKHNFAAFAAKYCTILVDLLDYGKSSNGDYRTEPPLVVRPRALRDLLDKLGIERASFVGNSLGGTTSLAFAIDYPEMTNRLVLTGPGGFLYPPMNRPTPTEGHRRIASAMRNPSLETFRDLAEAMVFDPAVMDGETIAERLATAQLREALDSGYCKSEALSERVLRHELHKVAAKTLIFWGKDDRVNPYEIGIQLMRDVQDASLTILKNCGHWVQGEHPKEFNRIAVEFLDS